MSTAHKENLCVKNIVDEGVYEIYAKGLRKGQQNQGSLELINGYPLECRSSKIIAHTSLQALHTRNLN